jgi:hypothetical protein
MMATVVRPIVVHTPSLSETLCARLRGAEGKALGALGVCGRGVACRDGAKLEIGELEVGELALGELGVSGQDCCTCELVVGG